MHAWREEKDAENKTDGWTRLCSARTAMMMFVLLQDTAICTLDTAAHAGCSHDCCLAETDGLGKVNKVARTLDTSIMVTMIHLSMNNRHRKAIPPFAIDGGQNSGRDVWFLSGETQECSYADDVSDGIAHENVISIVVVLLCL